MTQVGSSNLPARVCLTQSEVSISTTKTVITGGLPMPGPPPNKLIVCDLTGKTSQTDRCNAISAAITAFNTNFAVWPQYVLVDDTANAAYLGWYSA